VVSLCLAYEEPWFNSSFTCTLFVNTYNNKSISVNIQILLVSIIQLQKSIGGNDRIIAKIELQKKSLASGPPQEGEDLLTRQGS